MNPVPVTSKRGDWPRLVANAVNYLLNIIAGVSSRLENLEAAAGMKDEGNSTQTPLGAGETFTGEWADGRGPQIFASYKTDADGALFFEFSHDGVSVDSIFPFSGFNAFADGGPPHIATVGARFSRVRYVNGPDAQSAFSLHVAYGDFGALNAPLNAQIKRDADAIIVRQIDEIAISSNRVEGERVITKQGCNFDVDAAEDIWDGGGDYTGFSDAAAETFQIVSTNPADSSGGTGARTLLLFYLNDDYEMFNSNGAFLTEVVTLNGTTPVTTTATGKRVWYAYVTSSGSDKSNAGDITISWSTTTSVVFSVIRAGYSAMLSTAFTVPAGFSATLHRFSASMLDNTANNATMCVKSERFGSNTFVQDQLFTISTESGTDRRIWGGRATYPEKTNMVLRCTDIDNINGIITGSYEIRLSKND